MWRAVCAELPASSVIVVLERLAYFPVFRCSKAVNIPRLNNLHQYHHILKQMNAWPGGFTEMNA